MAWICENCRTENDDTVEVCRKCESKKDEISSEITESGDKPTPNKYPALITISNILGISGWVIAVIGVIASFYIYSEENLDGLLTIIPILIGTTVITISFLAFSELIKLLIDIEKNTRSKSSQ